MIPEHLQVAFIDPVGRDLTVVNNGPIQNREGMCPAPPAGRIGWETVMGRPDIARIVLQTVKVGDVFGITDALEGPHVFAAGENKGPLNIHVDPHDHLDHEVILAQSLVKGRSFRLRPGLDKITVQDRHFRDFRIRPCRNPFLMGDINRFLEKGLRSRERHPVVTHDVQGIVILVIRIDPVGREAASQAVPAVMLSGYGADNDLSAHPRTILIDDTRKPASRYVLLIIPALHNSLPFVQFEIINSRF